MYDMRVTQQGIFSAARAAAGPISDTHPQVSPREPLKRFLLLACQAMAPDCSAGTRYTGSAEQGKVQGPETGTKRYHIVRRMAVLIFAQSYLKPRLQPYKHFCFFVTVSSCHTNTLPFLIRARSSTHPSLPHLTQAVPLDCHRLDKAIIIRKEPVSLGLVSEVRQPDTKGTLRTIIMFLLLPAKNHPLHEANSTSGQVYRPMPESAAYRPAFTRAPLSCWQSTSRVLSAPCPLRVGS